MSITLVPALALLAAGGWAVATSLDVAGALGPWEEVAESGRDVVELARPDADPALAAALDAHRAALSESLTQARRWAFLGERFLDILPWLTLGIGGVLALIALAVSRKLARQLARPIRELVVVAERLGEGEPLPPPVRRTVREVRMLDDTLRDSAHRLAVAHDRALALERVRVWGEMARRVAHEMKNPLTPLRLAAHRLSRAPRGEEIAEVAEVIGQEVRRLEELAAQFSALGRPPEGPPTEVDVAEMLRSLLGTDVPATVDAHLDAPAGLPPVLVHHDPILRAFRNLIRNAVDAVEDAPQPRVEVAVRSHADAAAPAERWLEVRVADNGTGLPPGSAERIFEPDFTTKTRGTGLGLALVRQAVEAEGGTVTARERERGAELVVRIPAIPTPAPAGAGEERE